MPDPVDRSIEIRYKHGQNTEDFAETIYREDLALCPSTTSEPSSTAPTPPAPEGPSGLIIGLIASAVAIGLRG